MDWYGDYSTTSSRNGVSVQAGIDLNRLPVPAVKYRISNDREEPVGVRIDDVLPEGISTQHVGFDPWSDAEHWRVYHDGRLVWSRALHPGQEVLTLYGVWFTDPDLVYDLLEPPTITAVQELDEAQAQAGQPRQSTLPDELRPAWWFDDEETAPKHIIDEDFSRERTAPLRQMVEQVEGTLMGGASEREVDRMDAQAGVDQGTDSVGPDSPGLLLTPPAHDELQQLLEAAGPVDPDRCYHLRLAARQDDGLDEVRALSLLREVVTVLEHRFDSGWADHTAMLDVVVETDLNKGELSQELSDIDAVVDTLITEVGAGMITDEPDAESMTEFEALKSEVSRVDPTELDAELAGSGDEEAEALSITELVEEYTSEESDPDDTAAVPEFVAELRAGTIADQHIEELKSALGIRPSKDDRPPESSVFQRTEDLANEVDRLQRIADALLDELQLVTADMAKLQARVTAVEADVGVDEEPEPLESGTDIGTSLGEPTATAGDRHRERMANRTNGDASDDDEARDGERVAATDVERVPGNVDEAPVDVGAARTDDDTGTSGRDDGE